MTRLGFLFARTLRDESALQRLSVPQSALLADLAGKRIALIGNARALAQTDHGTAIDAADLVIRINRAPMPSAESHGTRTDWLALATRLSDADRTRIAPARILWMSPKRKRLDWHSATSPGFYLHPLADYRALADRLGAPPTTGAMMIDLIARSDMARLDLYGFDFFASLSLSGRRSAEQVPHDFSGESRWVQELERADRRIHRH
ncbi:Glycosyltransferase family 29 (sialyltransferase) [Paracoccus aminovorans]|uniref:Glycosyltransferase family 29 (Sialyltransferase) n=1 Tax=Paracoccus aminovorans TaxID=34004 RepID=A0A1I3B4D2_9RHOB|nr:glycosyltransferase family 29 protein [Paracoccus aminovorans]CQR87552.1 glycosyltransferase [Paracoccus aminovorans]SFH57133.1 Glycosyltransferase family 29 (sialyltransferase) [Paracoccus aminovorans]